MCGCWGWYVPFTAVRASFMDLPPENMLSTVSNLVGTKLSIMLCCRLETWHAVWTRGPTFPLCTESYKLSTWSYLQSFLFLSIKLTLAVCQAVNSHSLPASSCEVWWSLYLSVVNTVLSQLYKRVLCYKLVLQLEAYQNRISRAWLNSW
jgi:hypothetical protein